MITKKLQDLHHDQGQITDEDLERLAKDNNVPLYRLQELVSFFPHFRRVYQKVDPVTKQRQALNTLSDIDVYVCRDISCHLRGAPALKSAIEDVAKSSSKRVDVHGTSCIGRCDRAPAIVVSRYCQGHHDAITDAVYAGKPHDELAGMVSRIINGDSPPPHTDKAYSDHKLKSGQWNDWQIDVYTGGNFTEKYEAVRRFLAEFPEPVLVPETVPPPAPKADGTPPTAKELETHRDDFIAKLAKSKIPWMSKLTDASLTGFGGAGIPAYSKWFEVWKTKPVDGSTDKYIVCNGDESEPSTFKDRELLLQTPHLVIEGVILAGLMTNAKAGYIYVRHEYTEQIATLKAEIETARKQGACGRNIFGTKREFNVEVFTSPGGYICGEESALIEAMEDRRGQPRNKPPEMQTNGLYDKPTVVNNVETLAWVPAIMLKGGEWYAKGGINGGKGRRFFSICGDLENAGVFEVKAGTTLGELIALAGGTRKGLPLTGIAPSGPSGGIVPAKIPVPADFESRFQKNIDGIRKRADGDMAKAIDGHTQKIANLAGAELESATKAHAEALAKIESGATRAIDSFTKLMRGVVPEKATVVDAKNLPLDKGLMGTVADYLRCKLMLGAGIAVYAGDQNFLDHALKYTEFFRNESCGKCIPCRIGSQRLVDLGTDLARHVAAGTTTPDVLKTLSLDIIAVDEALKQTSICGLGRVAGSPLASIVDNFADTYKIPKLQLGS